LITMNNLTSAYIDSRKWRDAENIVRECLGVYERHQPQAWLRFHNMSRLGAALVGQGKYAEAETHLIQGYDGLNARATSIPPRYRNFGGAARARIVALYEAGGKPAGAEKWRAKLGWLDLPIYVFAPP